MTIDSLGIGAAAPGAIRHSKDEIAKINDAATQFEAILIDQMLRSARSPDGTTSIDGESDETGSTLLDMSEQQFAQALASSGGLGIGKMIVSGLEPHANR